MASRFSSLPFLLDRWTAIPARLEPADAIVVLAQAVEPGGELSDASLRRTLRGVTLFRRGLAPLLVLSGTQGSRGSEGEVRAELARDLGVPADAIVAAASPGNTTREETASIASILRSRGARSVLLVTGSQHMARARDLFLRAGLAVRPAPVVEATDPTTMARRLVEEFFARLYYRVAGYI